MYQLRVGLSILLTFYLIEVALLQNIYCEPNLCPGRRHIACNNNGSFSRACSPNARLISISTNFRRSIVGLHNSLRNQIARGSVYSYKPAMRMATMSWNEELARLSAFHVKRCTLRHDQCHNTELFRFSGQNGGRNRWFGYGPTVQSLAVRMISSWISENKRCYGQQMGNLTIAIARRCGHFTTMIQEKNNAVGCSILQQVQNNQFTQYMTCNYAYKNVNHREVYRAGIMATDCTSGINPQFPALCSIREMYRLGTTNW